MDVEETLRRWFPEASLERDDEWLVYALYAPQRKASALYSPSGDVVSILEAHQKEDDSWCEGAVPLGEAIGGWTVVQDSPLTLAPSLLCARCGDHGFIREGRWIAA
jgi:hypothetical protein